MHRNEYSTIGTPSAGYQQFGTESLDDSPMARMERIRDLLAGGPKKSHFSYVKSPQHKAAKRLGIPIQGRGPSLSPPRNTNHQHQHVADAHPPSVQFTQPQQASVAPSEREDASKPSVLLSLKIQNENLRGVLHRANMEITDLRNRERGWMEADETRAREIISGEEQYYRDYITVERAVEEREHSWRRAVAELDNKQDFQKERSEWKQTQFSLLSQIDTLRDEITQLEKINSDILSRQWTEPTTRTPPRTSPPRPTSISSPTSPIKQMVFDLKHELNAIRRHWNSDKAIHLSERSLWEKERQDLLETVRILKLQPKRQRHSSQSGTLPPSRSSTVCSTVADVMEVVAGGSGSIFANQVLQTKNPTTLNGQSSQSNDDIVSDMQRRLQARERKKQRVRNQREKISFDERIAIEKQQSELRELIEDDETAMAVQLRAMVRPVSTFAPQASIPVKSTPATTPAVQPSVEPTYTSEVIELLRKTVESGYVCFNVIRMVNLR